MLSDTEFKEVIIIGNGPSAISLSYMLAGNWPYYDPIECHPNEELHCRLTSFLDNELKNNYEKDVDSENHAMGLWNKSIVGRDLDYLSSGLTGRSLNPVSILFDTLQHPDADFGSDLSSTLIWKYHPKKKIDHLVIGKNEPGGVWATMANSNDILSISLGKWMQLPGSSEELNTNLKPKNRVTLNKVAKYFSDYVDQQGLSKYFKSNSIVSKVKYDKENCLWIVYGYQKDVGFFQYNTLNVVLATGAYEIPNRLEVRGEDFSFVIKSFKDFERLLNSDALLKITEPIMVVGAGLQAADALILAKRKQIPVIHVFRRHPNDPNLIFNQLSEKMYPEYFKIYQKMKDKVLNLEYKAYSRHVVSEIKQNKEIILQSVVNQSVKTVVKVSFVVSLIGRKANLEFIEPQELRNSLINKSENSFKNNRNNLIKINPYTHQCLEAKGLYAIGSLVGDNFVRFVQGGALAISNHLSKKSFSK